MVKIILRDVRKAKGLSIQQLSNLSKVSCGHISEIESGINMKSFCKCVINLDI